MTACAAGLRLSAVSLDINAPALQEGYFASWRRPAPPAEDGRLWQAEIPLTAGVGVSSVVGSVRPSCGRDR